MSKTNTQSYTVGVKLLTGKSFSVIVGPADNVAALKQRIFEREGIPPQRQNLIVMGKLLEPDSDALSKYNLKAGDMVCVAVGERHKDINGLDKAFAGMNLQGSQQHPGASSASSAAPGASASATSGASASATSGASASATSGASASATSGSTGGGSVPGTDITKLRTLTIQHFATVTTVLRPHSEAIFDESNSRWPRQSQAYCVYKRKEKNAEGKELIGGKELRGIITFGLSNPYQNTFYYAIGIGIEIMLECPTPQARLSEPGKEEMTGASISDSRMFAIVHEIAHQCFALGLQIRQLLEKLQLLTVEIAGVALPAEYIDPETGRCCVLLGHLGDPGVPRGFNVTVPHQHQWILQSVLFVPARLLTHEQCLAIRKDGAEARRKIAEKFVENKSFSICDVPADLWPKLATELGTVPNASPAKEAVGAFIAEGATATALASASKATGTASLALSPQAVGATSSASSSSAVGATSSASSSKAIGAFSPREARAIANAPAPAVALKATATGATSSALSPQAVGAKSSASSSKAIGASSPRETRAIANAPAPAVVLKATEATASTFRAPPIAQNLLTARIIAGTRAMSTAAVTSTVAGATSTAASSTASGAKFKK